MHASRLALAASLAFAGAARADDPPSGEPVGRCHMTLAVSEAGYCLVRLSRLDGPPSADAPPVERALYDDGTSGLRHAFVSQGAFDAAILPLAGDARFDASRARLAITRAGGAGEPGLAASYRKRVRLPLTLGVDIDRLEPGGGPVVAVLGAELGLEPALRVRLSTQDGFTRIANVDATWSAGGRDEVLLSRRVGLEEPDSLGFSLPDGNSFGSSTLRIGLRAEGLAPVLVSGLTVRGRLVPTLEVMVAPGAGGPLKIEGVRPGSGAERAGLLKGDEIVGLDGRQVGDFEQLVEAVQNAQFGKAAPMVLRRGGVETTIEVMME